MGVSHFPTHMIKMWAPPFELHYYVHSAAMEGVFQGGVSQMYCYSEIHFEWLQSLIMS